ncbi:MAG: sigma-70 family RNA polymerase sigma factor [Chloroflexi bacterium]|nr:sigma-70 family RNA polymerase sigma factor [Chloroflexota bacterium]
MTFLWRSSPGEAPLADADSFAAMYEKNHLHVFRFLMALCGGQAQDAEDMTAETFLRAWDARRRFRGDADAVLRWLFTIARRILIDRRRYAGARPEADLDENAPDDAPESEAILLRAEQMQEVVQALQRLPVAQREMVVLRYVMGWRVNAIAAHLQMPENTVSVSLRRALQHLQRWLSPA